MNLPRKFCSEFRGKGLQHCYRVEAIAPPVSKFSIARRGRAPERVGFK